MRNYLFGGLLLLCSVAGHAADQPDTIPTDTTPKIEPAKDQTAAQWKTAYYKRGFVGNFQAGWAGGVNSTLRLRVPMPFDSTQVRLRLTPMRDAETIVSKITLAPGVNDASQDKVPQDNRGKLAGKPVAVTFAGALNVTLTANQADVTSDAVDVPITRGVWYLQESYASEKYPYAYSVDGFFHEAGDRHDAPMLAHYSKGGWPGSVYRIEVLTTDTRPIILCYGDSITHGYNSTPNGGQSYPEILGRLTNLPVLNLGVNGDVMHNLGATPSLIKSCKGVESVIMLMGINDIVSGRIKTKDEYAKIAANFISTLQRDGKKVYWGTLTPAVGNAAFDKDAAKETLRQDINAWIRTEAKADAIIDFDAALADPDKPLQMRAEYQSDWLHPSDAGYQKMAEVAAQHFAVVAPAK